MSVFAVNRVHFCLTVFTIKSGDTKYCCVIEIRVMCSVAQQVVHPTRPLGANQNKQLFICVRGQTELQVKAATKGRCRCRCLISFECTVLR